MTESTKLRGPKGGKLTLVLDPAFHREIKMAAVRDGYTMKDFVLDAVREKMAALGEGEGRKAS